MKTVIYNVAGLINSQSKTTLLSAIDKIQGVQEAEVDISRGKVEIQFDEPASRASIKTCIEETGFDVE